MYTTPIAQHLTNVTRRAFWSRVLKTKACWVWVGHIKKGTGYGKMRLPIGGRRPEVMAHRVSYVIAYGALPEGTEIDHLCRVKHCVNPAHLEAVPHGVNVQRGRAADHWRNKARCPRGHPYNERNTYIRACRPNNRICLTCHRERDRIAQARRRNANRKRPYRPRPLSMKEATA